MCEEYFLCLEHEQDCTNSIPDLSRDKSSSFTSAATFDLGLDDSKQRQVLCSQESQQLVDMFSLRVGLQSREYKIHANMPALAMKARPLDEFFPRGIYSVNTVTISFSNAESKTAGQGADSKRQTSLF